MTSLAPSPSGVLNRMRLPLALQSTIQNPALHPLFIAGEEHSLIPCSGGKPLPKFMRSVLFVFLLPDCKIFASIPYAGPKFDPSRNIHVSEK